MFCFFMILRRRAPQSCPRVASGAEKIAQAERIGDPDLASQTHRPSQTRLTGTRGKWGKLRNVFCHHLFGSSQNTRFWRVQQIQVFDITIFSMSQLDFQTFDFVPSSFSSLCECLLFIFSNKTSHNFRESEQSWECPKNLRNLDVLQK